MEKFGNDLVKQSEGKVVKQIFTTESDSAEPSSPVPERVESTANNNDIPNRRASIAVSNFSNMIDPNIPNTISSWISQATRAKRRATMIDHSSVKSGFISLRSPNGVDFTKYSEISDQDLPQEFENFLDEMNIQGSARENMIRLSIDQKRTIILTHMQSQELEQRTQSQPLQHSLKHSQQKSYLNIAQDYDAMSDTSGKIQIRDSDVTSITSAASDSDNIEQKSNNRLSLAYWFYGTEQSRSSSPPLTNMPEQTKPAVQTISQNNSIGLFGSLLGLYPAAGNSAKLEDTPEFYIEKLTQKNATPKSLADTLLSLRIALSSAKLSWLREFIDNRGLFVLESILEKHTVRDKKNTRNSDQDDRIQSQCIRCLRALMNTETGFRQVLKSSSLVASIVFCLHTINNKLRSQVADVLAALCVLSLDGHKLVVGAFTEFRVIHEEKFRFQYLVDSLRGIEEEDSTSIEYKAAGLSLINAIVNSPDIIEERILLRDEFERRGIDNVFKAIKATDPPESVLKQIEVYQEERQEDLDELYEKAHEIVRDANDPLSIVAGLLQQVESDKDLHRRVIETLKNLLRVSCKNIEERCRNEIWTLIEQFIEQIISLNNLGQEWQKFMKEYHSSIQHIVGKYSLVSGDVTDNEIDYLRTRLEELMKVEKTITTEEKITVPLNFGVQIPNQNLSSETTPLAISDKQQSTQYVPPTSPSYFPKIINMFRQSSVPTPALYQKQPTSNNNIPQQHKVIRKHPLPPSKAASSQSNNASRLRPPPPPPPPLPPTRRIPLSVTSTSPPKSSQLVKSKVKKPPPPPPSIKNNERSNFITESLPVLQSPPSNNTNLSPLNNEIELPQPPLSLSPAKNADITTISSISKQLPISSIGDFDIPSIPSPLQPQSGEMEMGVITPSPPPPEVGAPPPPPPPPPPTPVNHSTYDNNISAPVTVTVNNQKGPLKQLFWSKISKHEANNTVWKDIKEEDIPLNIDELDELFGKTVAITSENDTKISIKSTVTTLIDFNRANNIAIMLARIKMPYSEIKDAILELNDEKLSIENLRSIKQYIPTSEEIELVKEYDGDLLTLGNAENYFREIMVISRMSERLSCMIFRRRFEVEAQELLPEINILHKAHEDLKNSSKFRRLLKTVLAIGNYLNANSFRGNASGFQLDALLKMRDTKAIEHNSKGTATLLHYLAFTIETNQKELIPFMDELPHLEAAARVSVTSVMSSVTSLVTGISQIKEETRILKRARPAQKNDRFLEVMHDFVKQVEPTIESIREIARNLDNELQQMLIYYGEDPKSTKPEDFFGLIVSFSSSLMKARKENEEIRKKTEKEKDNALKQANKKPSDAISIASSNDAQGDFDDAIRELRSGLKRNRGRPVSKVFLEIAEDQIL